MRVIITNKSSDRLNQIGTVAEWQSGSFWLTVAFQGAHRVERCLIARRNVSEA